MQPLKGHGHEFVSLRTTLPRSLVARLDKIAVEHALARSEVLAAALRMYLEAQPQRHADVPAPGTPRQRQRPVPPAPPQPPVAAPAPPRTLARVLCTGTDESVRPEARDCRSRMIDPADWVRSRLATVQEEPIDSPRLRSVLEGIAREVDARDASPGDHSLRVARHSAQLAARRGMSADQRRCVELAGLVHDIGKACVPAEVLCKVRLSTQDLAVMRRYPEFGAELVALVPSLRSLAPVVAAHQERWDGSGYPRGLRGVEIPLPSRIVAVCDVYEVLTNDRRYRPAYSPEQAERIVADSVGTLWDPEIALLFLHEIVAAPITG